jgi:hypothetical protein
VPPELERVASAARRYHTAEEKATEARRDLYAAIREASKTSSVRQIAAVAGISSARVHQIVHGK